jgi:hypothetical protein
MFENHVEEEAVLRRRRRRPATSGIMVDKISGTLGGKRLPISVAEGNRRPHDPVQAAKFALEGNKIVLSKTPIFKHFKEYKIKENLSIFQNFTNRLTVCMGIPSLHSTVP